MIVALFGASSLDDAVARAEGGLGWGSDEVLDPVPLPDDLDGLVALAVGVEEADLPEEPVEHREVGEAVVVPARPELASAVGALEGERLRNVATEWDDHAVDWYGGADDIVGAVTVLRDYLSARVLAGQQVYFYISP